MKDTPVPQALEVMAINHKNNASKKCLHRGLHCNTKYCYVDTIVLGYIFYDVWQ